MPLYQYRCHNGHVTDEIVTYDCRNDPVRCTVCHEMAVRIISPVRHEILFRPGYYNTVGSYCETEMEYHNKYSMAVDKVVQDSYSGDKRRRNK